MGFHALHCLLRRAFSLTKPVFLTLGKEAGTDAGSKAGQDAGKKAGKQAGEAAGKEAGLKAAADALGIPLDELLAKKSISLFLLSIDFAFLPMGPSSLARQMIPFVY